MLERQRIAAARAFSSALIIGSSVFGGCSVQEYKAPKLTETLHVPESVYPFIQDKFPDPIYRASSLIIFTKDGSYGHGSLVKKDENLYIYTIGHVADAIILNEEGYVNFPGLENSIRKLEPLKFTYHPRTVDYIDPIVSYRINDFVKQELESMIEKRQLTPLEIDTEPLNPASLVTVPRGDVGKNTYLKYTGKLQGALNLTIDNKGVVCSGRSGGGVLRVFGENPSNKLVGILSAGKSVVPDPQGLKSPCYSDVLATPIN